MPEGLDIDHKLPLSGTMPSYSQAILIATGKNDWSSRIEDEAGSLAQKLKGLMGRGGEFSDPYHSVSVINSSFPPSGDESSSSTTSAYLLPSFKYIPSVDLSPSSSSVQNLVQGYLLAEKLHPAHDILTPAQKDNLTRKPELQSSLPTAHDIDDVLILICGHGGRDERCGIMGPLLGSEFERILEQKGISVLKDAPPISPTSTAKTTPDPPTYFKPFQISARVGMISHMGGHKFAGNVIIYIPPSLKTTAKGVENQLKGAGIWYGRVEPRHVEGLIEETVLGGSVIGELFRGGMKDGKMLRL
jgi:Sucrase/ferredoxin-like